MFGESAPTKTVVSGSRMGGLSGPTSLTDNPRKRRPKSTSSENIVKMVLEYRRLTDRDLVAALDILLGHVSHILRNVVDSVDAAFVNNKRKTHSNATFSAIFGAILKR